MLEKKFKKCVKDFVFLRQNLFFFKMMLKDYIIKSKIVSSGWWKVSQMSLNILYDTLEHVLNTLEYVLILLLKITVSINEGVIFGTFSDIDITKLSYNFQWNNWRNTWEILRWCRSLKANLMELVKIIAQFGSFLKSLIS